MAAFESFLGVLLDGDRLATLYYCDHYADPFEDRWAIKTETRRYIFGQVFVSFSHYRIHHNVDGGHFRFLFCLADAMTDRFGDRLTCPCETLPSLVGTERRGEGGER